MVAGLALLAVIPALIAQSSRRPASGLQAAVRALNEGRYADVFSITDKLEASDPGVSAVRARAAIARGRYGDAETVLRPVAERAPTSEAALELGLLLRLLGRSEAQAVLTRVANAASVARDTAELGRAARALGALGRSEEANAVFRDAAGNAARDPAINTAWGELFLEKYNKAEALKSFQAALQEDNQWVPALLGSARALAEDNPPQAVAIAQKVLQINPSHAGAYVFLASQAVDAGKRDEGREALQKALAINPASLEARSLLAGLAYVEDKNAEVEAEIAKVLAIAPRHGEVYRVAGELAAHNYRFDEAVTLARRALTLDPNNARTLADLGVHLLRTGDEPAARQALEAAFKIDPYDVVTFNLLQMMDTLDKFVTVDEGDIVLRLHKDEAPVLQEYALALARQALSTLAKRYAFTPKGPILIEIFPKHDDFAVRNVGLPGMIGALGACFGRVVTMDSPRARPPGEFQWEATLWHELAHVVTLQMSKQRVPRWLTEGISVYEEKHARPEWARGADFEFAQTLERGDVLKLRDLNAAFNDLRKISLAYFQASLLVEHLVSEFREEGLRRLVSAFGEGLETEAALKSALDTDFDRLQASFDRAVDQQFGAIRRALGGPDEATVATLSLDLLRAAAARNPESYRVQMALGRALRKEGAPDDALKAFEQAAALVPVASGPASPHMQIAQIALEKKDQRRAISALQTVLATDFDNLAAARQLAALLRDAGVTDPAALRPVYDRMAAIDPFDAGAHTALGRLAMQRNDSATAIREFRTVVALGPIDLAAAHTDLAESYLQSGRRADAKKQTLAALEIAPSYERAQELLLKLTEGRP